MKVLVAGVGKLGFRVARALVDEGMDVVVIDKNELVIENVINVLDVMNIKGNALDLVLLRELDMKEYDVIIATTRSDEANVILCTMAKKMGCKKAIARVRDPEYHKHLTFIEKELDIDYIINPDHETAQAIEKYLLKKYLLMSDEFVDGKVKLVEFNIGHDINFINKKLVELDGFNNLLIATIIRDGESIIPNGQTILEEQDIILIVGAAEDIEKFDKDHSGVLKEKAIEKVMIVGGGKVGLYLGMLLDKADVETTVVEIDMQRCLFLKERLPNATIIHGDGTDLDVLEEEMLHTFDGFVAATGIDEANLLISLVAGQIVYKSVAKISRNNYNSILDKLAIDGIFNTTFITAGRIIKMLRGSGALSINLMLNGDAEFTEIVLEKNVKVIDKKIKELQMPKGILIVAAVRGNKVLIPNGDTILLEGDHVILFWNHENLGTVKKMFYVKEKKFKLFSKKKRK